MTIQSNTLRPGLLVSLSTVVRGNVRYQRQTVEDDHKIDSGAKRAVWETTRTISDPEEHERAIKARNKARSTVASVCAYSSFGLLCPDESIADLDEAIAEARRIADEFNASAQLSHIGVYVMTGRVAQDDVEAVRAINSEVRTLMDDMEAGIKNCDVKVIRDAANRARALGSMLSDDAETRVQIAIETARKTAREIKKAGETAAQEIDKNAIRKISQQRTAFLDLGDQQEIDAPKQAARSVDLAPVETPAAPATKKAPQIDLEK